MKEGWICQVIDSSTARIDYLAHPLASHNQELEPLVAIRAIEAYVQCAVDMAKAKSPIRLDQSLMDSAASVAKVAHRSAAEQIELWADIGRTLTPAPHKGQRSTSTAPSTIP